MHPQDLEEHAAVEFWLTFVFVSDRDGSSSLYSGISPGTSRKVSMDEDRSGLEAGVIELREADTRDGMAAV